MEILSLGEKIKRKRKELNMTLKDLAKDRITPGQISLIESGRTNPSMDLLEYLADNLNTTIEYLIETEESQAEKIINYYEYMASSYIHNKEYILCEKNLDEAFKYIEKYKLEDKKGRIIFLKAELYRIRKNYIKAEELYLDAQINFNDNENYIDVIHSLIYLSKICIEQNSYYAAINYLKQAEVCYKDNSIGNEYILGDIYYSLAKVCYINEKEDEARKYAMLAKEKFNEINDVEGFSKKLMKKAEEFMSKGNLELAILYSEKAYNLLSEVEKNKHICDIQNNLGMLFYDFDEPNESERYFKHAEKIKAVSGDDDIIDTMINLGKNNIKLKKIQENRELLEEIDKIIDKKDIDKCVEVSMLKANICMLEGDYKECERILNEAYEYAKSNNYLRLAAEVCLYISKYFSDNKNEESAQKYLSEAVELYNSIGVLNI